MAFTFNNITYFDIFLFLPASGTTLQNLVISSSLSTFMVCVWGGGGVCARSVVCAYNSKVLHRSENIQYLSF